MSVQSHAASSGLAPTVSEWFAQSKLSSFQVKVFLACLILNSMEGYDLFVYGAAVPVIMPSLGLNAAQAGMIGAAASLGTLLGALFLGPLADQHGRKKTILVCTVISCASMALAGISMGFYSFCITRILFGIANGGMVVNIMALLSEYVPNRSRATMVGIVACGSSIGAIIGALLGIYTFAHFGWRPVFIASAALMLFYPLYVRWLPDGGSFLARTGRMDELKDYMRRARPDEALPDSLDFGAEKGKSKAPVAEVFKDGRVIGVMLFWVCYMANLYVIHGFNSWLPKLMVEKGFALEKGLTFMLPVAGATIVVTFFLGRITDRVGAKPVLAVLYLLSFVSISLMGFADDYVLLMALSGFAGIGFNGAQNMMNGYAPTYFPPAMRSTALGYNFVCGRLGGMAGPLLVGMLLTAGCALNSIMFVLAVPSFFAAVAVFGIPEKLGYAKRQAAAKKLMGEPGR